MVPFVSHSGNTMRRTEWWLTGVRDWGGRGVAVAFKGQNEGVCVDGTVLHLDLAGDYTNLHGTKCTELNTHW